MISLSYSFLEASELHAILRPFWFEIRRLVLEHRQNSIGEDQKLLQDVMGLIFKGAAVNEWESRICDGFLQLSCSVGRSALDRAPIGGSASGLEELTDRICSIAAAAGGQVTVATKLIACGAWVQARILAGSCDDQDDLDVLCQEASEALAPIGVPLEALADCVQTQFVIRIARGDANGLSGELRRTWAVARCAALIQEPGLRLQLAEAATALGVDVPQTVADSSSEELAEKDDEGGERPALEKQTGILGAPQVLEEASLEQERQNILFDLTAIAFAENSPLKQMTIDQVTQLDPGASAAAMKSPFYFAASDLWNGYSRGGDEQTLAMAERVSLYVYSYALLHRHPDRDTDRSERANSLHLWMLTQFPRKALTCELPALLSDASRVCAAAKTRRNDLWIRQGLIEAFAGICKMLQSQGDGERRDQILQSYGPQLRDIHEEYISKAEELGIEPREEEVDAWDSLGLSSVPDSKGPVSNILKDPDFQNVINRGATEETYKFVCVNKQRIQEILERRLDVRLGLEYVMEPKLLIYDPKSRERGTLDPAFVAAKETLDAGDFGRAATLFDRMAPRLQGVSRNIVRDYQAYALAKDKKQMPARLELDQICGEEFYSPSAYWNLACCQLSEDMEQRLETFVAGLKHAPHPRLLDGAVYLGLFLNDARTVDWLPCLTYTEALLLYYKLEYEGAELSNQEKQAHVLRLGRYSVEGELVMPEPMNDRLPEAQIQRYMTGLLERKQPAAFEFWLRCRELISTNRYQHWEVKADFLEKTGRRAEAAKAFEEEFRARLRYFGILARNAKDRRRASELLQYTRRRLDTWLGFCWPELKNVGFNLFNMAKNFEKQYDTSIVSNRLRKIYDTEPPPLPPTPPTPTPTPENLSQILTTVGAECQSRLRDLSELSSVRWHLDTLLDALRRGSSDGSTEALGLLMGQWENYSRLVIDTERQTALLKAQTAYADLRKNLQRELTDQQWSLAGPFLNACKRVNESLARDAKLLPNLTVEAVTEGAVEVDSTAEHTGFALRVRCASGDTAVRLKGATLTLDDSVTTFALRDRLEEVQMQVGPTDTCVLSFDTAPNLRLIQPRTLQCVLAFEYAGGDYHTPPLKLQLVQRVCPPLPNDSPYISGRPLDPVEIEGHFFGRKEEQEAVLASVRDGQQRLRYVCGIRRAGKSSLLNSIEYEVGKRSLPLIPVYLSAGEVKSLTSVGRFLFNLLAKISSHSDIAGAGVQPPPEERCCENMPLAYSQFVKDLAEKIPGRRVLALLDDFQSLIEAASDARDHNPAVTSGIAGLLNIIYANGNPRARILWVFAGHRTITEYRSLLPGADLWGTLRDLPIDFLDRQSVKEIITEPLRGSSLVVPEETISLVCRQTAGHPEIVQKIAELMLFAAVREKRWILTPADVDAAVRNLALFSDDSFAIAWYPEGELSDDQSRLMVDLIKKTPVGGRIDPGKLVAPRVLTDKDTVALDDLKARRILDESQDGTVGVRAYVLDLWLHKMLKDIRHREPDSPAIFIDVANLTTGRGSATLNDLETTAGEGIAGCFALKTVLSSIEAYVYKLTPIPVAAQWVVNYPERCPAVMECNAKGYRIANIPEYLWRKSQVSRGADDTVLQETMNEVQQQFPNVKHFVLVTGDKDYRVKVENLLKSGKHVHVVSRASALGKPDTKHSYDYLAKRYPERFTVKRLEELLEEEVRPSPDRRGTANV